MDKLFTHMCLCLPSSINWYRCKLGAKQVLQRYTIVSADLHLRLVSGRLQKQRSAPPPPYGHLWLGKDFSFSILFYLYKYFLVDGHINSRGHSRVNVG